MNTSTHTCAQLHTYACVIMFMYLCMQTVACKYTRYYTCQLCIYQGFKICANTQHGSTHGYAYIIVVVYTSYVHLTLDARKINLCECHSVHAKLSQRNLEHLSKREQFRWQKHTCYARKSKIPRPLVFILGITLGIQHHCGGPIVTACSAWKNCRHCDRCHCPIQCSTTM